MSLRMGFSGRFSKAAARADGRARGRAGGRRGTRRASACAPRAPACREHLQPAAPLCGVWAPWRLTALRTRLISHKTARRGVIRFKFLKFFSFFSKNVSFFFNFLQFFLNKNEKKTKTLSENLGPENCMGEKFSLRVRRGAAHLQRGRTEEL